MAVKYAINDTDILTNCVSWWSLNEESDATGAVTRYDAHGTNDLTDVNTTASGAGQWRRGADFESTNSEYFTDGNSGQYDLTSLSISVWVKLESTSSTLGYSQGFISTTTGASQAGFELRQTSADNTVDFYLGDGTKIVSSTTALTTGTWYHIVCTMSTTEAKIYINGSLEATNSSWGTMTAGSATLYVGNSAAATTRYMDGVMQDASFYSAVLTLDQVGRLYNEGNGMVYGIDRDSVDGSADNPTTQLTFSHTVDSNMENTLLVVHVGRADARNITSVTYAGVDLTQELEQDSASNTGVETWYLVAPSTGTNNVVVNIDSSSFIMASATTYAGVDQTNPIDASDGDSTATTTHTTTATSTVDDVWGSVGNRSESSGQSTAGTNSFKINDVAGWIQTYDTNGTFGVAGSKSMTVNTTGAEVATEVMVLMTPASDPAGGGGTGSPSNFLLMGAG